MATPSEDTKTEAVGGVGRILKPFLKPWMLQLLFVQTNGWTHAPPPPPSTHLPPGPQHNLAGA